MRANEQRDFTVNVNAPNTDFFVDTGIVRARIGAANYNVSGTLLSSSVMTFSYSFPETNVVRNVELSFDGDNYFNTAPVTVRSFSMLYF